jgi:hypothetical protein
MPVASDGPGGGRRRGRPGIGSRGRPEEAGMRLLVQPRIPHWSVLLP